MEAARQEFERRIAALVDCQSQELTRRAEGAIAAYAERLQPRSKPPGRKPSPGWAARSNSSLAYSSTGPIRCSRACKANRWQEKMRGASTRKPSRRFPAKPSRRPSANCKCSSISSGRTIRRARTFATETLANIEAKGTETTLTTFESLFKTAEWYEKKVQTQMQATWRKGSSRRAGHSREKAGEISGLFAAELDHYSRSYMEHTQGQIEEVTSETAGTRAQAIHATWSPRRSRRPSPSRYEARETMRAMHRTPRPRRQPCSNSPRRYRRSRRAASAKSTPKASAASAEFRGNASSKRRADHRTLAGRNWPRKLELRPRDTSHLRATPAKNAICARCLATIGDEGDAKGTSNAGERIKFLAADHGHQAQSAVQTDTSKAALQHGGAACAKHASRSLPGSANPCAYGCCDCLSVSPPRTAPPTNRNSPLREGSAGTWVDPGSGPALRRPYRIGIMRPWPTAPTSASGLRLFRRGHA